jgi:hypothetical protein
MSDENDDQLDNDQLDNDQLDNDQLDNDNAYVNQLTLNFLISKTQLHKLNKLKQKDLVSEPAYDKNRIHELFNQLLNNNRPDDLLEDVKTCFDAFIEKSIYYLEIHDKNENIQNERTGKMAVEEDVINEDINYDEEEDDEDDEETNSVYQDEEYFEEQIKEPVKKINTKYSKKFVSKGVEDIHKLPLDWFNTTRQSYKINQIIPRKKEIIIDNSS